MNYSDLVKPKKSNNLIESIKTNYSINESKVTDLIGKYHKVRITDSLVESYVQKIKNKEFSLDPVILESRNQLTNLIENCVDFQLNDGSKVAISPTLFENLNIKLLNHQEAIEFMKENSENFIAVCKLILEENNVNNS